MDGMMDDLELIREEAPEELERDNRSFMISGIIATLAGIGIFLGMNADKLGLSAIKEDFFPFVVMAGIGALSFGLVKGFRKIFRKGNLSLPSLQIRRKTTPNHKATTKRGGLFSRPANFAREAFRRPNRKLAKSNSNRVFMGVAGGLAEHSGMSSSLIRLLFIGAFAISGGAAAFIYFALGIFLPVKNNAQPNLPPPPQNNRRR